MRETVGVYYLVFLVLKAFSSTHLERDANVLARLLGRANHGGPMVITRSMFAIGTACCMKCVCQN